MSREYWANLILCGLLAVFAIFAVTRIGSALTPKGLLVSEPEPSKEAASLLDDVKLTQFSLVRGQQRQVAAEFYIQNNSHQDVKNVNILCEFFDENGSFLDREKWILYGTFPGGKEERFTSVSDRFIHVKGPVDCLITDLQPVKDPFFKLHRSTGGGHGEAEGSAEGHGESKSGGH
ncbi:MAG: hypothetical protein OEM01_09490 [Desulfobulbaceae bacterium]|nr:hypothetical protein [Desulfobulbaceae bacterium]